MSEWFFRAGSMKIAGPISVDEICFDPSGVLIKLHDGHTMQITKKWELVETIGSDRPNQCDMCKSDFI